MTASQSVAGSSSNLRQRVTTALLLAPLVVAAILYLPRELFSLLLGAIVVGGGREWAAMARLPARGAFLAVLMALLLATWFLLRWPPALSLLLLASLAWWLVAAAWVVRYPASARYWSGSRRLRAATGFLLLVPPWGALVALHGAGAQGPWLVLLLMLLIWGADSGAYFAGRRWGRERLAPRVSPGKSWQGLWGGLAAALLVALLSMALFPVEIENQLFFIMLCMITVLFSVLGDLTESMFKREAGMKDSGALLPGHGGLLDRIDSLTAAAPVFVLGTMEVCL